MGFGDITKSSTTKISGFGSTTGFGSVSKKKLDLNSPEGLQEAAEKAGVGQEASDIFNPPQKLSALQRIGQGLGAFNTAEAVLTGIEEKSVGAGVEKYLTGAGTDLAEAFTGKNIDLEERRTYKDVVEAAGIENKILKGGIGFLGDVLLDPTTYFGGAIAKGANLGVKGGIKLASKIGVVDTALKAAEEGFGRAFKFGHGTSKGLPEKALEISSKLSKTKEEIVASNLARLGTRTLSKSQQEELVEKLLLGKRTELEVGRDAAGKLAGREAAQSSDPLVQKTIEAQTARSQKFAKQAGVDDPYAVYFPGIKKDNIKKFVEGTKTLKVGSEGYLKQFKNLLTDEQLIKNPSEAFAKREFEIAKDNIVRSELNQIVKQYGKPVDSFTSADEALQAGFKEVKEKGMFGKVIGYLPQTDKKFLDDLISPEFTSIDIVAKTMGFDALTSLFKRSVTGLFPSFHVRNFVSGHIQNFEVLGIRALNPKLIGSGQKMALKIARQDKSLFKGKMGKAMKAFTNRFGTSSSYIADIADATRQPGVAKGLYGKTLGQEAFIFRKARAVGNFIETSQKATAYLTALAQGKTIAESLKLATRAGFDYRALTGFESKILRRLIPFYSFTRKNIELQLRTLGENPQRINQIIRLMDNIEGEVSAEERAKLPDYAQEGFILKTGTTAEGLPEIATGFGTPLEAFTSLFGFAGKNFVQKQLSTLNNIIKAPLERAVGKDFFLDRELSEVVEAKVYQDMPQFVKDFIDFKEVKTKDFKTGKEKIKYTGDPEKMHLLRQLPTTRGVSYLSAIFDDTTTETSKLLYALTGVRPRPIDLETVEYFRNRDRQKELEDLLIRSGIIKRFENVYIPKETKESETSGFGVSK